MNRLSRTSVVLAAGLLLAATSPPRIEITVSREDGRPFASLTQNWGFIFRRMRTPCVNSIFLTADVGVRDPVWRLEAEGSGCVPLSGFTIGQVPAGFVEVNRLPAQTRGTFHLIVMGIGHGGTDITLP
jgi:hypothetical protein